jgi:hypothetical protein
MSDDYAGQGPAGAQSVADYSAPGKTTKTNAVYWDLQTKAVLRDSEGKVREMHWVDQAVALALGVTQGNHASDPTLGNRLRFIPRNSPDKLQNAAEDEVRRVLKDLTDRADIVLLSIETNAQVRGRLIVIVKYINRHLTPDDPSTFQFTYL